MHPSPNRIPWRWVSIQAAVAIILRGTPADREVLLIERAVRTDDPWSGDIALPGGRRQKADRNLGATARRETEEETGLNMGGLSVVGWQPAHLTQAHRQRRPMAVHPAVFVWPTHRVARFTLEAKEATDAFWLPLAELQDPANVTRRPWGVGPVTISAPAWSVDGRIIWGLTHSILTKLLKDSRFLTPQTPQS
ncbi:MAG: 8-oxo-dGTP pyrophosphatase MutT (NUDIX family) [Myxococcota bacterium]|jgi:8-oxo-dGTP pyrophosphatase MutT (NUDIX family)